MKKQLLILSIIIAFKSCKKSSTTTNSSIGSGNTTNSNINPSNDTVFYAFYAFEKLLHISTSPFHNTTTTYNANVMFVSTPQKVSLPYNNPTTVTSVSVDNTTLMYQAGVMGYNYINNNIGDSLCTWQVVGQNVIPSFTYTTNNNIKPVYTNYNLLPDTIDRAQANILQFNVTNVIATEIFISDNTHLISYPMSPGLTSYTISASSLNSLNSGSGSIQIIGSNQEIDNISGKGMIFNYTLKLVKDIYIK